jgi:CHAT domain-containing protein
MVPNRRLGTATETRPPLGVECAIGRWTAGDSVAGCRALPLTPAYVIAPTYDGADALPLAQREAAWLVEELGAERIDPATFSNIEVKLREGGRHLIHFACHGSSEATEQTIYLNDNAKLDSTTFEGMDAADSAFAHARPLVFLNACEVGRGAPALVGVGGFAATFIRKGAGAVIAPLWSVKDDVASEVARVFYTSLGGSRPFAEILRDFRARAYDAAGGEDSYAAYCYYGDPQAARAAPSGVM